MAWIILFVAGLLEVVWLLLFKLSDGYNRMGYAIAALVISTISFGMVGWTLKTLPVGTAYAIWTGMGAAGGAVLGILLYNEPANFARIACVGMIIAGIVGLKVTG